MTNVNLQKNDINKSNDKAQDAIEQATNKPAFNSKQTVKHNSPITPFISDKEEDSSVEKDAQERADAKKKQDDKALEDEGINFNPNDSDDSQSKGFGYNDRKGNSAVSLGFEDEGVSLTKGFTHSLADLQDVTYLIAAQVEVFTKLTNNPSGNIHNVSVSKYAETINLLVNHLFDIQTAYVAE